MVISVAPALGKGQIRYLDAIVLRMMRSCPYPIRTRKRKTYRDDLVVIVYLDFFELTLEEFDDKYRKYGVTQ